MDKLGPKINPDGSPAAESPSSNFGRFTNRDSEQKLLLERVNDGTGCQLPILMFYGVAGQGKSWLLRQLREITRSISNLRVARFSFDQASGRDFSLTDVLWFLRRDLRCPAPRFDLVLGVSDGLRGSVPTSSKDTLSGKLSESALEGVIELVEEIPAGAGLIAKLTRMAGRRIFADKDAKILRSWLASHEARSFFENLKRVAEQQPEKLGQLLVQSLAIDLAEFLPRRNNIDCRAVIFLDTFEHLQRRGMSGLQQYEQQEKWIFDLWRACHAQDGDRGKRPFLQFVLAGRDRLRWDDPDWGGYDSKVAELAALEQNSLGGLLREDAETFLLKCQINDSALRESILEVSLDTRKQDPEQHAFHAFALGLCADTVIEERERNEGKDPRPESFALDDNQMQTLARRFLSSLDELFARKIRRLALTPRFNHSALRSLFEGDEDEADLNCKRILSYSFVEVISARNMDESPAQNWFRLHPLVKESIAPTSGSSVFESWNETWERFWISQSLDKHDEFFGLAWFHRWIVDPEAACSEWSKIAKNLRSRADMIGHAKLLVWWSPMGVERRKLRTTAEAEMLDTVAMERAQSTVGLKWDVLSRAESDFRQVLEVFTRVDHPRRWAMTQDSLGSVLGDQGELVGEQRGIELLKEAVTAFRKALEIRSFENHPEAWAATQNNLAGTLKDLGGRVEGEEGIDLIGEAVSAYRNALEVFTKADHPETWAGVQTNLGSVLLVNAKRVEGERATEMLEEALSSCREALKVFNQESHRQKWALTQDNIGNVLKELGERALGNEKLKALDNALAAYRHALEGYDRETFPSEWSAVQNNLGNGLKEKGFCIRGKIGADLYREAVVAYRCALEVKTRENFPQIWAQIQNNLGSVLSLLGSEEEGRDQEFLFTEAEAAFEQALTVNTRVGLPFQWAQTQTNIGGLLTFKGREMEDGDFSAVFDRSISAHYLALEVYTREAHPQEWADSQNRIGAALAEYGKKVPGLLACNIFEDAAEAFRRALEVFTSKEFPEKFTSIKNNLRIVLNLKGQ